MFSVNNLYTAPVDQMFELVSGKNTLFPYSSDVSMSEYSAESIPINTYTKSFLFVIK